MPQSEGLTSIKDPKQRYTKAQCIGRGASKVVYKAFDEVEGLEVAWNEVLCSDACLGSGKERSRMLGEITMLRQLKHKNIMRLYDWWYDKQQQVLVFITELLTDGSLRRYIRRKHAQGITLSVLKRYAWQILQGLVYLHGHYPPIIHRDLKCDNIFVNGASGELKIGDLGFATLLRGISAPLSVIGTPEFMAPELYDEHYDEKVDIYSYGMCLLELATLEYPYSECTNPAQIYRKVSRGTPPAALAKVADPQLKDFILLAINPDPHRRPEARQLLVHPFFEDLRQHIRAKGWLKGPAPALGAAAAAADPVRNAAAAAAVATGTPPGGPAAVRVPMSAPDGLAAIAAALHASDGGADQDHGKALPPAARLAAGSESHLLHRQQQQHLMHLLQQGQQKQQQPAGIGTRAPVATASDAVLQTDHSSGQDTAVIKPKTPNAAFSAVNGPDIQQQPDQVQQQQQQPQQPQKLSSNVELVITSEQPQRQQHALHVADGPLYRSSSSSSSAGPPPAATDGSGSAVLSQTPLASPFADASWASCSSAHSWVDRAPSTGAAAASAKELAGAASSPAPPAAVAAGSDKSPLHAFVRHHAATKGRRHSLDELSEDDVLFEADSQSRTDDADSDQDDLLAIAAASNTMNDVWQQMQLSTGQQQQPQRHQQPQQCILPAVAAAACGQQQYLDTIHEDEADDEGEVDCVCRRIDNQQLSFNVGFFNRGMRKRVGFQYNAEEDTVDDIAVEMLENLSLMPQQAEAIARKIRAALEALGMFQGSRSFGSTPCSMGPCSIGPVTVSEAAPASRPSLPADSSSLHMTGKNAAIAIVATAAASAAIESCSTPLHGSVDAPGSHLGSGTAVASSSGHTSAAGSYTGAAAEGLAGQAYCVVVSSSAGTPQSAGHTLATSHLTSNHLPAAGDDERVSFGVADITGHGVGMTSSSSTAAAVHACAEQLVRELSMLDRDQGQALLQTLQEDLLIQSIAMPEAAAAVGVELGVPLSSPQASPAAGMLAAAAAAADEEEDEHA